MKTKIISILLLLCTTVYFVADGSLYFYGKSNYNIFNESLPFGYYPEYWDCDVSYPEIGFTIRDQYGLSIIIKDMKIKNNTDSFKIDKILKYTISNNTLITKIVDDHKKEYFVDCSNSRQLRIVNTKEEDYEWIIIDNNIDIEKYESIRSYSILIFLLISSVIVFFSYIIKKVNN